MRPPARWQRLKDVILSTDPRRRTLVGMALLALTLMAGSAGVMLLELSPAARGQGDWLAPGEADRTAARRAVWDQINARWGRGALRLAREGFVQPWAMRQERRSPAYTTRWADLPVVRAG